MKMRLACFLILSMKSWFLAIILAIILRMEVKSRWSERLKEAVTALYYRATQHRHSRRTLRHEPIKKLDHVKNLSSHKL